MKPYIGIVSLLALGICLGIIWPIEAAHHVNHNKQVLVVTDYAVPLAVPVSPYGGVTYQQTVKSPAPPPMSLEDRIVVKLLAAMEAKQSGNLNALGQITKFGLRCATCHKTADEKLGRPQFASLDALNGDQCDDCMEAILDDTMPKGGHLTPKDAGDILKELAKRKREIKEQLKIKAAVEAPPVPSPPVQEQDP